MKKEEEKKLNKNSTVYIPPETGKKLQLKPGKEFVSQSKNSIELPPILSDKKNKDSPEFKATIESI